MVKSKNLDRKNELYKPLGFYLCEADLINKTQLREVLNEQKHNNQKIGEILVSKGYIKPTTLEYFIKNIVESERKNIQKKRIYQKLNLGGYLTSSARSSQKKREENDLGRHSIQLARKLSLPTFYISPKKICRFLLVVIAFLIFASVLSQFVAYFLSQSTSGEYSGRLFNLDEEANIPTLYSALSLAVCSILLAPISYMKKLVNSPHAIYWKILSAIFLFISLDEICEIHELSIAPLRRAFNTSGFFYFAWVIPACIFLAIFLLGFFRFIKALPKKTRNLFIVAGTLYTGGALGMELIGGYHAEIYGENSLAYSIITSIEESLEMLGILVFIYALLLYIKLYVEEVNFRIQIGNNKAAREFEQQ